MTEDVSADPLITVVVPTKDRGVLIRPTLDAFQAQTFSDFEVRVADDGGSDDTEQVVQALDDSRFHYHWAPHAGKGATRNRGARHGTGRYVCFFDSDDWPGPNHLKTASEVIRERDQPPAFFLDFEVRDQAHEVLETGRFPRETTIRDELLRGNCFPPGGVFVRADVAEEVRWNEAPELITSEDWLIWLRIAARYPIPALPGPTWALMEHGTRTSRHWSAEDVRSSLACVMAELEADPVFIERWGERGLRNVRGRMKSLAALRAALAGQSGLALGYLARAAAEMPIELFDRRALAILKHTGLGMLGRH